MATEMRPVVVDISHHNEVTDWNAVVNAGIQGVIHKSSQGTSYVDPTYAARKLPAMKAGLLFGSYHFATGQDGKAQAEHFLKTVGDTAGMLLCLDWEDNPKKDGSKDRMSYADAVEFCKIVYERTGQRPVVYGGNTLKELIPAGDTFFAQHRLWLCQYGPKAVLPKAWNAYWLWQYTGDGIGMPPHSVKGIAGTGIDLNVYNGSWLASEWAPTAASPAVTRPVEVAAAAIPAPATAAPLPAPTPAPTVVAPAPVTHAEVHAEMKENDFFYNLRRGLLKQLGIGTGAAGGVSLVASAFDDPVATAMAVFQFAKTHPLWIGGAVLAVVGVIELRDFILRERVIKQKEAQP